MTDDTETGPPIEPVPETPVSPDRELVLSRVELAALKAGVQVPDAIKDALNVPALLDESGQLDQTTLDQLIGCLPPIEPVNPYAQNIGIGPQGENRPMVTTREQLSRMTPHEIVKAVKDGRISIG